MKSEFLDWFKKQHGPRGSRVAAGYSDQQLRDEKQRGRIAAAELEARALWDEKQKSALYAWTARNKTPNVANNRPA